jgi:hypothetical protein
MPRGPRDSFRVWGRPQAGRLDLLWLPPLGALQGVRLGRRLVELVGELHRPVLELRELLPLLEQDSSQVSLAPAWQRAAF